ncbi:MAG: DUF4012 domain-containing protein, partial [Actinobacteria bacterium]|nr:DUF4012 domain-containing protein [Actinomycetota bacterium]
MDTEKRSPAVLTVGVILVGLGATLLWISLLASPYRLARGLLDGGRQLSAAQDKLSSGSIGKALDLTLAATASADRARAELADPSPLLEVAAAVPQIRDALGELDHVVSAMELSAEAALGALSVVEDALGGGLITRDPDDPDGGATIDLSRLESAIETVAEVRVAAESVVAELEMIDLQNLPRRARPRVTRAIADARAGVEQIETTQRGFSILPAILGADGERNYLIGFQNPSEQRGTGGAILQFKVLKFDGGRFDLVDIEGGRTAGTVYNIDQDRRTYDIPLPDDAWMVRQIEDAQRFGNANWSPDWPLSAGLMIEYAYTSARENDDLQVPTFDGFIVVDPRAVEKMMAGVRTFTTARSEDKISARNVVDFVLYTAYGKYPSQGERRSVLAQIVDGFFRKALGSPRLEEFATGMGDALSEKNVQIWMNDPAAQAYIEEMDWDGGIKRAKDSDYVFVVEQNVGGNKLDYFDAHTNTVDVDIQGRAARVSTEMRVRNGVFGPQPNWVMGDVGPLHRPMMNLYVPETAELLSWEVEGERLDSPEPAMWVGGRPAEHLELGKKVWSATLNLTPGEEGAVRFDYRVPAVVQRRGKRDVYRLIVQRQPKVHPEELTITLSLPDGARDVRAKGWTREGDVLVWNRELTRDTTLNVSWLPP